MSDIVIITAAIRSDQCLTVAVILAVPSNSVSDIVVINGCSDKSVSDCDSDTGGLGKLGV